MERALRAARGFFLSVENVFTGILRPPHLVLSRIALRASYNGNTVASQATNVGSIPIARSTHPALHAALSRSGARAVGQRGFTPAFSLRALWSVFSQR